MRYAAAALLALAIALPSAAAVTYHVLEPFDLNKDGQIDKAELTAYFKTKGQNDADAEDSAGDVLSALARCGNGCPSLSIEDTATAIETREKLIQPEEPTKPLPPCKYFSVKRTVEDAVHLRGGEAEFPAVFSYARDKHADDRDQLNVLGALETFNCQWDSGKIKNLTFGLASGFDFEIEGGSKPEASTIAASLPLSVEYIPADANAFITHYTVTVTPAFKTDRAFDREVWDTTLSLTWRSKAMLRAGLRTSFPNGNAEKYAVWWQPVLRYELGDVKDPAGNEDLTAVAGSYNRFAPGFDFRFWPTAISDRITIKASGVRRLNVGDHSRSYVEGAFLYDLTADGSITFSAIYRHGRKPPAFGAKDQWLIGLGFQR